jgi:hypothetical protein
VYEVDIIPLSIIFHKDIADVKLMKQPVEHFATE